MTDEPQVDPAPYLASRRIVFHGLGALGVAAALAGCGSASTDSGATSSSGAGSSASGSASSGSSSGSSGTVLAKTSEVPEGGGIIIADAKVVITQPSAGTYKAFTATCTHQGFLVTSVADDVISCSHHGSEYSATDGSVKRGPAPKALTAVKVTVDGENIVSA